MAPNTRSNRDAGSSKKRKRSEKSNDSKKAPEKKGYTRLILPNTKKGSIKDPTVKGNWENSVPTTEEEMQQWIADERNLCDEFLKHWKVRAEDTSIGDIKDSLDHELSEEWKKWENFTDIETGEIHDETQRINMENSMRAQHRAFVKTYDAAAANEAHIKYSHAQAQWEDFLYFQNEWNRRGKAQGQLSDWPWRENMVDLYDTHGIGNRGKLPSGGIGPNQLHSFPDNIRHTANGEDRRSHLDKAFPTSDIRLDNRAIGERRSEVEHTRHEKINEGKEEEEESSDDQRKYAVDEELPENHQPYHAVTENNRRTHTSWETNTWGPAVSNKEQVPFKQKQITKSTRPRWRTIDVPRLVREAHTVWDSATTCHQELTEHIVWEKVVELDEDDNPILDEDAAAIDICEKPAYQPQGMVTETHEKSGLYPARKEAYNTRPSDKHPGKRPDEMSVASDEEDNETLTFGDDVSEEDVDLFRLSYLNRLDAEGNIPGAKKPGSKKKDPTPPNTPDGGSDDDSDNDDPKPGSGPSRTKPSKSKPSKSKSTSNKASNAKSLKAKSSKTEPPSAKPSEYDTFSIGRGKDKGFRIAESTRKFSKDIIITQRDRVPLQDDSAADQFDDEGNLLYDVIPHDIRVGGERAKKFKKMRWEWNKAKSVFQLGNSDVTWRPVFVLRKFNKGTGKFEGSHDFIEHVRDLVDQKFSKKSIARYNRSVAQWHDRNDADTLENAGKTQPRWTQGELVPLLQDLNNMAATRGLRWMRDHWTGKDSVISRLKRLNDEYREKTLNLPTRGPDALRGKIGRSKGTDKPKNLKNASNEMLDSYPNDFFTIEDIDRLEEEDNEEDDVEGDAGGDAGDESNETEGPPRKNLKL